MLGAPVLRHRRRPSGHVVYRWWYIICANADGDINFSFVTTGIGSTVVRFFSSTVLCWPCNRLQFYCHIPSKSAAEPTSRGSTAPKWHTLKSIWCFSSSGQHIFLALFISELFIVICCCKTLTCYGKAFDCKNQTYFWPVPYRVLCFARWASERGQWVNRSQYGKQSLHFACISQV